MNAVKKAALEKRAVLGLAALFAVVFVMGPLRSLGLFRLGAAVPTAAGTGIDRVNVTRSVGGLLREGWEKLDQQVETATARASDAAPKAAAAYTAFEMRDPLKSLLPAPAASAEDAQAAELAVQEAPPPPPALHVEGLVWGGDRPKAIIDGRVYSLEDTVAGAKILAIDRGGVTIEHLGQPIVYSTASAK